MDNKPIEETKKEKNIKRAGMYISLFVCIATLIIGFWSAYNRTSKLNSSMNTTAAQNSQQTNAVKQAQNPQTDITAQTTVKATLSTAAKTTQSETVSPTATFFTMPVGGEIIKNYSDTDLQYSKTYKDWRLHCALDIAAEKGTQVHASGNGKVTNVYEDSLLGNVVEIDHGNGIVAYYCGLNSALVKVGQTVEVGKTIGGIGEIPSESSDAMHLHFAVKVNGKTQNPVKALNLNNY